MAWRMLAIGDTLYPSNIPQDNAVHVDPANGVWSVLNEEGYLVDPQRILRHPGFDQIEGEGIYTYPHNPDETHGFIYSPAKGVDTTVQKTMSSSIVVQQPEVTEDVVITEIWTGGGNKLSSLSEMFQTFYKFWTTTPAPGEFLIWQPFDLSVVAYAVYITDLKLGQARVPHFKEYRVSQDTRIGAYVNETLSLSMKVVKDFIVPRGSITLEGL